MHVVATHNRDSCKYNTSWLKSYCSKSNLFGPCVQTKDADSTVCSLFNCVMLCTAIRLKDRLISMLSFHVCLKQVTSKYFLVKLSYSLCQVGIGAPSQQGLYPTWSLKWLFSTNDLTPTTTNPNPFLWFIFPHVKSLWGCWCGPVLCFSYLFCLHLDCELSNFRLEVTISCFNIRCPYIYIYI